MIEVEKGVFVDLGPVCRIQIEDPVKDERDAWPRATCTVKMLGKDGNEVYSRVFRSEGDDPHQNTSVEFRAREQASNHVATIRYRMAHS